MTKKLSIIIPCYNEEKTIRSCLESILNQSTARENYEIIVVDNGSKDNSFSIASEISDKVILAPNKKVGAVRNLGALESTASWIAFVDADCSIDHDWIERALDRKSTRLNSSHVRISYAVFCLKKQRTVSQNLF